jgi:hypothetical protein
MTLYEPLAHAVSLPALVTAWGARYHYLYKLCRVLRLHPTRGDKNALMLSPSQQQQLADVLNARTPRPRDLEQLGAEDLHAELDRLSQSYDRLAAAHEVTTSLLRTYKEHLDWLAPVAEERLGRIEALLSIESPDFLTSLKAVKTLAHPAEIPLPDVQEAAVFCAAVGGIFARRLEGDQAAYDRFLDMLVQQPLGLLRGQLAGHLFGLGATLQAALDACETRADVTPDLERLEKLLITVMGQIKIWANDSLGWLRDRVPLAPSTQAEADDAVHSTSD